MKPHVMLTVDLANVTNQQRAKFYEVLGKLKWTKIEGVTTTFRATWKE